MCLCKLSTLKVGGVREGGCSLESAMQIYGNLAPEKLLGILKPIDFPFWMLLLKILIYLSFVPCGGPGKKKESPFHIH